VAVAGTTASGVFDGGVGAGVVIGIGGQTGVTIGGPIRNVRISTTALSDSELQAITR